MSENLSCPCLHTEPCNPRCTCVHGGSSVGCSRCCTYGSKEQQKKTAERLAALPARNERLTKALEHCHHYFEACGDHMPELQYAEETKAVLEEVKPMTPDETTRIEFARRQGWKEAFCQSCMMVIGPHSSHPVKWCDCEEPILPPDYPNPTDRNHVHTALMGMSPLERKDFSRKLYSLVCGHSLGFRMIEQLVFETPLSTLVSCYLEATKERKQ
jgi:hypothetical protein